MKSSYAQKASITLPKTLAAELQKVARQEHRTLSGVLQEAARFYLHTRQLEQLQRECSVQAMRMKIHSEDDVDRLIHASRGHR